MCELKKKITYDLREELDKKLNFTQIEQRYKASSYIKITANMQSKETFVKENIRYKNI